MGTAQLCNLHEWQFQINLSIAQEKGLNWLIIKRVRVRRQWNMISGEKHSVSFLKWFSGSSVCAKIHLKSPFTLNPGGNYTRVDGAFLILEIRVLEESGCLWYVGSYPVSESVAKWGRCSPFINLQHRHTVCLSVASLRALSGDSCMFVCLKEDFTHQSGKWRLNERDPRSIRIKVNGKGNKKG